MVDSTEFAVVLAEAEDIAQSVGQRLTTAHLLLALYTAENRGQRLHVAGSLAVDRFQGSERVQLRVTDVAVPDPGPAVIK